MNLSPSLTKNCQKQWNREKEYVWAHYTFTNIQVKSVPPHKLRKRRKSVLLPKQRWLPPSQGNTCQTWCTICLLWQKQNIIGSSISLNTSLILFCEIITQYYHDWACKINPVRYRLQNLDQYQPFTFLKTKFRPNFFYSTLKIMWIVVQKISQQFWLKIQI